MCCQGTTSVLDRRLYGFVTRSTYIRVYSMLREAFHVLHEIRLYESGGVEGMDRFRLVSVDHTHNVITLGFWLILALYHRA
jgi:hypothetical protein